MPNLTSKHLWIFAAALMPGCEKSSKNVNLAEEEKNFYGAVIHQANRPIVTFASNVAACEWVFKNEVLPTDVQESLLREHFAQVDLSSRSLRALNPKGVSIESRGLAEDIAARRAMLALAHANIRHPDAGAEILGWIADAISLNDSHGNERQRDELRMQMAFQRLGNYAGAAVRTAASEQKVMADNERIEREIRILIENHRIALGGVRATQLIGTEQSAMQILEEQRMRAEGASKSFTPAVLDQTLRGRKVDGWVFEQGEIKAVTMLSTQIMGNCVLNEAVLDVVGTRSLQQRKIRVRMAHNVYVNGNVSLIAISSAR